MHVMLREGYTSIKKNYYDPAFHGIDLDARYHEYDAKLNDAGTLGEGFHTIAAFLAGFHDSHLFFMPPARAVKVDPGYRMQMIGEKCLVTRVRPQTDAARKVQPGDQVAQFAGYNVGRQDLHDIEYAYHTLSPSSVDKLSIQTADGQRMTVTINNAVRPLKHSLDITNQSDIGDLLLDEEADEDLSRDRYVETPQAFFWKMSQFQDGPDGINSIFEIASKYPAIVFDLRGNPGGYIVTLEQIVGHVFPHDVKIADRVGRKESKPQLAKTVKKPYSGKIVVLIDSKSASSSELFARVMQLEHRGTVIGDTSAGAVMEAHHFSIAAGTNSLIFYGFSVTDANLLMADGKSLEGEGVHPDEVILPTPEDLAAGRDPVLAHAAELVGLKLDHAAAGKMFPFEWQKM
jgi:C-terminal processing protease CtpA/Prc